MAGEFDMMRSMDEGKATFENEFSFWVDLVLCEHLVGGIEKFPRDSWNFIHENFKPILNYLYLRVIRICSKHYAKIFNSF